MCLVSEWIFTLFHVKSWKNFVYYEVSVFWTHLPVIPTSVGTVALSFIEKRMQVLVFVLTAFLEIFLLWFTQLIYIKIWTFFKLGFLSVSRRYPIDFRQFSVSPQNTTVHYLFKPNVCDENLPFHVNSNNLW